MSLGARAQVGLFGVGLGAALMYFLDPARRRRRPGASVRNPFDDEATHPGDPVVDLLAGLHPADGADAVPPEVLVARVRAAIGHTVSHPTSIAVGVDDHFVRLSGPILAREVADVLRAVRKVAGSREVDDNLQRYWRRGGVPVLRARGNDLWPRRWRVMSVGAGVALGAGGLARGGMQGAALATTAGALLLRAATNRSLGSSLSAAFRPRRGAAEEPAIEVKATAPAPAPITDVVVLVPLGSS